MELKKALARALKLLPTKKDEAKLLRLIPGAEGCPSWVCGSDGIVTSVVFVEETLPNALFDATVIKTAVKDTGSLSFTPVGYGDYYLRSESADYLLKGLDVNAYSVFLNIPPLDLFEECVLWQNVKAATHAAGKTLEDYGVVHFHPDYVESLAKGRLARAKVKGRWQGLIPAKLFKTWPKGKVRTYFDRAYGFFLIGEEEVRYSPLVNVGFPDTNGIIPEHTTGAVYFFSTKELFEVVRQTAALAALGIIKLEFGEGLLTLRAWEEGGVGKVITASVEVDHAQGHQEGWVQINGKVLQEALKHAPESSTRLCYTGDVGHPLRLDSGSLTICIWQMG